MIPKVSIYFVDDCGFNFFWGGDLKRRGNSKWVQESLNFRYLNQYFLLCGGTCREYIYSRS